MQETQETWVQSLNREDPLEEGIATYSSILAWRIQWTDYNDTMPLAYFMKGKERRIIHPATSDLIESLLKMLSEEGEKATFCYIKKLKQINS